MCSTEPSGRSWARPPGRDVGVVHPQAGDLLEQVEDHLPLAEAVGHAGEGTHLHAEGGQRDQVRGDPVELHDQQADGLRPLRHLDAEQLLDRHAVAGLVEQRGQVVHAGHEGRALGPVAVLEVLRCRCAGSRWPPAPWSPSRPRGRGPAGGRRASTVLRPHVDDEALLAVRVGEGQVPVATGDGVDAASVVSREPAYGSASLYVVLIGRPSGVRQDGRRRGTPRARRRAGSPCAAGARPSRRA